MAVDSSSSDLVSVTARPCTEEHILGGATDTEVSDESQLLFLIDSQSPDPCTIIRAFDINGNLVPSYSLVIPEDSLPVYGMGFAVVGSDLYMVGGHCSDEAIYDSDYESDGVRLLPTGEIPKIHTHTYFLEIPKIPAALRSGTDLSKFINRGPRMKHRKTRPIVYAVNQTLYVLSRWVHSYEHSSFIDFESLVLGDDYSSSAALPNPPICYCDNPEPRHYHALPPDFEVGSHALVGDKSIVISLEDRRVVKGIYVFDLTQSRWDCVDTDGGCIGQHIMVSSGLYCAISLSGSSLEVLDKIPPASSKEVTIRGASKLVSSLTGHCIAAIGDAIFVFRTGCPSRTDIGPVYLTIDKYKVSGDTIAVEGETVSYLYNEATFTSYCLDSLFLQPVSLETRST